MEMIVVDTNVFVSASVTRIGVSWQCFVLLAKRRFQLAVTSDILTEYETTAERFSRRPGKYQGGNWRPLFAWVRHKANYVEPAPLGKQRSRNMDDDIFWRAPWPAARNQSFQKTVICSIWKSHSASKF
jgi:predicted nucleic acid-binding protein